MIFRRKRVRTEPQEPSPGPAPRGEDEQRLRALADFSRRLVKAPGRDDVAALLLRAVIDLVDVDGGVLLEVDRERGRAATMAASTGLDDQAADLVIDLSEPDSAVARVVSSGELHRVLDPARESLHDRQLSRLLGAASAVYVPLATAQGVLGVAVFFTHARARPFRRDEARLMQALANDAAVALERARYARELHDVGEREFLVATVARALRSSLDMQTVLEIATGELLRQLSLDRVELHLLARGPDPGRLATNVGGEFGYELLPDSGLADDGERAMVDRKPVAGRAEAKAPLGTRWTLPLTHHSDALGVVVLERGAGLDESSVALAELIVVETASALEHARLYNEGRRHLDEQLALARSAQSLTSDLRFERVLEHIVDEAVRVLRTTSATFYTYDRDQRVLTLAAAFGQHESEIVGLKIGHRGLAGRVVETGVSQVTNDYGAEYGDDVHPSFANVTRSIAVPVRWQGDLRGVITVAARDTGRTFSQHDVTLLEAFADLASLALHNAEAYRTNARQASIQAGFYRISQVLSASLSRTETLYAVAQAATEALDGSWAVVVAPPPSGDEGGRSTLKVEGDYGAPGGMLPLLAELSLEDSLAKLASDFGRVVTSRDLAGDERLATTWRERFEQAGVRGQIAVPISAHGRQSAIVLVCFESEAGYADEELVVANNLAHAAGAALERAGLFENERRTRRLAQALADMSALLAETLKTQDVLERIVEQAARLLQVDACSIVRARRSDDDLEVHACYGPDTLLVDRIRDADVGDLVSEVARTRHTVTVEELASETSSQDLGGERYEGYLGVPMRHPRGHLIGVISVYRRTAHNWEAAEISALESFAHSAATAIRNAELYANVKRDRDTIETILASIGEGIAATDERDRITLWNRAAEDITGISREAAVGRAWRDVLGVDHATAIEPSGGVIEAQPQGVPLWLSVTRSDMQAKGRRAGSIYAFRDVSASHTLDTLKSDFVSAVSYSFRGPLTAIYGFASTLCRDDLSLDDGDRQEFLRYISHETERLTAIVDDLLRVADIDAGSVEVQLDSIPVDRIVREVVATASERSSRHEFDVELGTGLLARADSDRLRDVLNNLIDNAIQFSPDGGEVSVEAQRDNGVVRINVRDTGIGIPPSERRQLFSKFYVSPTAREHAGSGLGLYISRGLVSAMGGRIWVSSEFGEGSTFTVELPAAGTAHGA